MTICIGGLTGVTTAGVTGVGDGETSVVTVVVTGLKSSDSPLKFDLVVIAC
jgi:hypothetical protein